MASGSTAPVTSKATTGGSPRPPHHQPSPTVPRGNHLAVCGALGDHARAARRVAACAILGGGCNWIT